MDNKQSSVVREPSSKYEHANHPAFDEWLDHFPLSIIDLFGIKTYQSVLPFNKAPHYLFYNEYSKQDVLNAI